MHSLVSIVFLVGVFQVSQSADWDVFTFTQEWPPTVCVEGEQEHHTCKIPSNVTTWSIHGLWPTKYGTEGPVECRHVPFDFNAIRNMSSELNTMWANMYADSSASSFWEHEWTKHGTCAMDLPATATEYLYFRKALDIMKLYDATMLLRKHQINPSNTEMYKLTEIEEAIKSEIGVTPRIECGYNQKTKQHLLYEVEICISKDSFKPISCDPAKRMVRHHHHYTSGGSSGGTERSNCPSGGFLYPPIPNDDAIGK